MLADRLGTSSWMAWLCLSGSPAGVLSGQCQRAGVVAWRCPELGCSWRVAWASLLHGSLRVAGVLKWAHTRAQCRTEQQLGLAISVSLVFCSRIRHCSHSVKQSESSRLVVSKLLSWQSQARTCKENRSGFYQIISADEKRNYARIRWRAHHPWVGGC